MRVVAVGKGFREETLLAPSEIKCWEFVRAKNQLIVEIARREGANLTAQNGLVEAVSSIARERGIIESGFALEIVEVELLVELKLFGVEVLEDKDSVEAHGGRLAG